MLRGYRKEIDYCTYCPKLCRFACPVAQAEARETSTPWGRQTLLYLVAEGRQELTPEIAETLYHCAFCMQCNAFCDHGIAVPPVMRESRAMALDAGMAPDSVLRFGTFFSEYHNPLGDDLGRRVRDLVPGSLIEADAQVIYWPGCSAVYSYPEMITDTVKVLEAIGVDYVGVWADDLMCCGEPIDTLGFAKEHKDHLAKLHKQLRKYKQILSGCPACVYNLKVRFAEAGFPLTAKIYHVSEFLAPFFHRGEVPLGRLFDQPVIYHDPCFLGRHLEVYDPPRQVLAAVCSEPVQEFSWNRNHSYCCGGGGGVPVTARETSVAIANHRLREAGEGVRKVLVSACPSCLRTFQKADPQVRLMDLVNVVARALR
jgi:Fe-S oxidoreductase